MYKVLSNIYFSLFSPIIKFEKIKLNVEKKLFQAAVQIWKINGIGSFSGDMVCAQFTTDHQWYRACIKTAYSPSNPNVVPTLENGLCVEVQYIDYGNNEWLPLSR